MTAGTVAIIGAECSGKTTLAAALARELAGAVVPEYLRTFVQEHGRVPTAAEQVDVMRAQIAAERAAPGGWVVSDAGALMTAVYSRLYYGDPSLTVPAAAHHRSAYLTTLWCDIDLPWASDEGQRDGPAYRERGHEIIGAIVREDPFHVVLVSGTLKQRLDTALMVLSPRK